MLGLRRLAAVLVSTVNRSWRLALPERWEWMTLMATMRLRDGSSARYTVAIAPCPSLVRALYRPNLRGAAPLPGLDIRSAVEVTGFRDGMRFGNGPFRFKM